MIRPTTSSGFELVDAVAHELIATSQTLMAAIGVAASRGCAVRRQNVDRDGRVLGEPIMLLPRSQQRG